MVTEKIVEVKKKKETKKSYDFSKFLKNKWFISTAVLGIAVIICIIFLLVGSSSITSSKNMISVSEAEKMVSKFAAVQGLEIDTYNTTVESGIYSIITTIDGNEYSPIYLTTDGKYIVYGSLYEFDQLMKEYSNESTSSTPSSSTVIPSDNPTVELFVMTHCPYGTQAEKGFLEVMRQLEDKANVTIRYVHYFMHEPEYNETPRQICIREEQNDKFIDYLQCFLEGDGDSSSGYIKNGNDPETCMKTAKIDSNKVKTCVESGKWEEYYAADSALSEGYGVSGSPTLVINGAIADGYGRDSASYLAGACSAFTTRPEECSLTLSSEQPSVYFGWTTTTSTAAGAC